MLMKKAQLALTFVLVLNNLIAQKVSFSALDLKGKFLLNIIGSDDQLNVWLTQTNTGDNKSKNGYVRLNNQLMPVEFHKFNEAFNEWKEVHLSTLMYNNKLTLLLQCREDKMFKLSLHNPFTEAKKFVIASSEKAFENELDFSGNSTHYIVPEMHCNCNGLSVECNHFVLTKGNYKQDDTKTQVLLDDKNNIIAQNIKPFIPQEKDGLKMRAYYGPYKENILCRVEHYKKPGRITDFEFNFINYKTQSINKLKIPALPDHYYLTKSICRKDDTIEMTGLYNEDDDKAKMINAKGFYKYTFNETVAEPLSKTITPLSQQGLDAFESIKDERGVLQNFSRLIRMDDGSYMIIGESYEPSRTTGPAGDFQQSDEKYFGIFAIGFDADGNYKWVHKINRKEKISGVATSFLGPQRIGYGSFAYVKTNNIVHVLFNDDDNVVNYIITSDGEGKKSVVSFGDKAETVIFPKDYYRLSETTILFPCIKNGKSEIVKLEY